MLTALLGSVSAVEMLKISIKVYLFTNELGRINFYVYFCSMLLGELTFTINDD